MVRPASLGAQSDESYTALEMSGSRYDGPMRPIAHLVLAALPGLALAQGNPAEGRKLVGEHRCEACHAAKTLGDAKALYLRKDRKVTSFEKLESQVARCNSELGLQLFPEDEEHVVAFLDDTYYKFKAR
jgi:hypothetical protein